MATASTGWACTHGASVISQTDTTATIRVTCYWANQGWSYNMNYIYAWVYCNGSEVCVKDNGSVDSRGDYWKSVSMGYHDFVVNKGTSGANISCYAKITSNSSYASGTRSSTAANVWIGAKTSYTVSYNANGGTGAPGNQTKWYGSNLTLSSTKPTRTGYSFSKWNTNANGSGTSYNPGAAYSGNAALTLYAIWTPNTYTVSYNANGGTGAPGNQTKTHDVNLTLSSTKPTRTNYNFLGWSTSANGGVVYNAGSTYSNNSTVTLYAVWELAYVKPRINNFSVERCTSNGTVNESGTYIKVTFDWATDHEVEYIYIDYKLQTADDWTPVLVTASGTSGSVSQVIGDGNISTEKSYHARAYVEDSGGATHSLTIPIGTVKFPIDVRKGGTGVAIGKVSEEDNVFDVNLYSKFKDDIMVFKEIHSKDYGYYKAFRGHTLNADNARTHGYYHVNSETEGFSNRVLGRYGSLEVIESRGTTWDPADQTSWIWQTYRNSEGRIYCRHGANEEPMSDWKRIRFEGDVLYNNSAGSNGTITLSRNSGYYRYIEIFYINNNHNNGYSNVTVPAPNGKLAVLDQLTPIADSSRVYLDSTLVSISGTSITVNQSYNWAYQSSPYSVGNMNVFKIIKVVGYNDHEW